MPSSASAIAIGKASVGKASVGKASSASVIGIKARHHRQGIGIIGIGMPSRHRHAVKASACHHRHAIGIGRTQQQDAGRQDETAAEMQQSGTRF